MNIDIYSDRAKQAIQSAQSLALARGHQQPCARARTEGAAGGA